MDQRFYVTTPIYYVNDRPHIGHVYTTTVADVLARYHRLLGHEVFFLTGTDEHAAKVSEAAEKNGMSSQEWADRNAAVFEKTFGQLGIENNDFIRTSQERHIERVRHYVAQLRDSDDVYLGEYEGWYDTGQEEYVAESKATEYDFKSPINGKPLVKKRERNYFFRLSKYTEPLLARLEADADSLQPDARRNEILARIREGLNDVPISRTDSSDWGIHFPGDEEHTIYVWIDALFNYLSTVDTDERREFWPADVHLTAKDIIWFHSVIWPAMLMALQKIEGNEWMALPKQHYAHSFWISEGQKMSKSLGNFIDLEKLNHYVETFSLDALRWFLATQGPLGISDSNFSEARFIDIYNTELANTVGNSFNRISKMASKYGIGEVVSADEGEELAVKAQQAVADYQAAMAKLETGDAARAALGLVGEIDAYIERTKPFKLAKEEGKEAEVGRILYSCAEAIRIAALCLWPFMPHKMTELLNRLGREEYASQLKDRGQGEFATWSSWGQLPAETKIATGDPLFPRYEEP